MCSGTGILTFIVTFTFFLLLILFPPCRNMYMVGGQVHSKMRVLITCLPCDAIYLFQGIFWMFSARSSALLVWTSSIQTAEKSSLYCCPVGALWPSPSAVTSLFSTFPSFLAERSWDPKVKSLEKGTWSLLHYSWLWFVRGIRQRTSRMDIQGIVKDFLGAGGHFPELKTTHRVGEEKRQHRQDEPE